MTDLDIKRFVEEIKKDPREAKALLAKTIVEEFFGKEQAKAQETFDRIFKERKLRTGYLYVR